MSKVLLDADKSGVAEIPVFTVTIHPATDVGGYWAECTMPNGGCNTQGDTLRETQINMYEAMDLCLEDDYPDVTEYVLWFVLADA